MAVKFISYVDEKADGTWFIQLTDTLEETDAMCNNLTEFQEKIEDMGMQ